MKGSIVNHSNGNEDPVTVGDILPEFPEEAPMEGLADVVVPEPLKDPTEDEALEHREFDDSDFWRRIPAWSGISREEFLDWRFQNRESVKNLRQLAEIVGPVTNAAFLEDVRRGLELAPMNLRLSPYILSLIDWERPFRDPIRRQFIPAARTREKNHPELRLDSLDEQGDAPVPGLVHRYPDKALFLALDVCPVYCRFCTRSYAVGHDTDQYEKVNLRPVRGRWEQALAYLASRPEVEDVVLSGGDVYHLNPKHLRELGLTILAIPHIRRLRFATKGPAVMPMKIISHPEWTDALVDVVEEGRKQLKEVCLHVHFNTTHEITSITHDAMQVLFSRGVRVRNQSVLIRQVNDQPEEMIRLVRQLSYMNVQPYYVYQHDMVKGVEELRTRVATTQEIEQRSVGEAVFGLAPNAPSSDSLH